MIEIDALSSSEAAAVAGVSVRDLHRVIDEGILPNRLLASTTKRSFRPEACALIAFYFGAANRLTAEQRLRAIELASELPNWNGVEVIHDGFLTINLRPFWDEFIKGLQLLRRAKNAVVQDPSIAAGIPVLRDSETPVYDVGIPILEGMPIEDILKAYPRVDRAQAELAAVYVKAVPRRGRPWPKTCTEARSAGKKRKKGQELS